jgi:ubiquinone/menaquinone biosynthesis C-methylase UbiE
MAPQQITYTDGGTYERTIGKWSQLAGKAFLEWLAPPENLSWIDVGCGNGAFTELLVTHCGPRTITGIDPSDAQLTFARSRLAGPIAQFQKGDAMSLPLPNCSFDAAVMALVIFFVPEPPKGVAEMVRVVQPGGIVAAYTWDMMNGGFPFNTMQTEMREMGIPPTYPPTSEFSRIEALRGLWAAAGLTSIKTTQYTIERTYEDFEDLWITSSLTSSVAPKFKAMPATEVEVLKARMCARSPADKTGRITCSARVTAVKGNAPTKQNDAA